MSTIRTDQILRTAIDAVGDKRVAMALGVSRHHAHRMARPTHGADATGSRNILDRVGSLIDLLGERENGRPVVWLLRAWLLDRTDRALGAAAAPPLTAASLAELLGAAQVEVGEAVQVVGEGLRDPARLDPRRTLKEISEAVEAIGALQRPFMTQTTSTARAA